MKRIYLSALFLPVLLTISSCGNDDPNYIEYKSGLNYIYSKSEDLHYFHLKEIDSIESDASSNQTQPSTVILEYNSTTNTFEEHIRGNFEPIREQYNTPYIIDYGNDTIYNLDTDESYPELFESCSGYMSPCYFIDNNTVAILDYDRKIILDEEEDYTSKATISVVDLETNQSLQQLEFDLNLQFSFGTDDASKEYYSNGNGVCSFNISLKSIGDNAYTAMIYQTSSIPGDEYYKGDSRNYYAHEQGYATFVDYVLIYKFDFGNMSYEYMTRDGINTKTIDMHTTYPGFVDLGYSSATIYDQNYERVQNIRVESNDVYVDETLFNDFSYAASTNIIGPSNIYLQYDSNFTQIKNIDVNYHIVDKISDSFLLLNDRNPWIPKNYEDLYYSKNYYVYDIENESIIFTVDNDNFYVRD